MNVAIAFLNDKDVLEKDNFFVINNAKIIEESTERCFGIKLNESIKPINYWKHLPKNHPIVAFAKSEVEKINYNIYYKCYFIVSYNLNVNELKNKLIDYLIGNSNEKIKESCKNIYKEKMNLKCLFDMKG